MPLYKLRLDLPRSKGHSALSKDVGWEQYSKNPEQTELHRNVPLTWQMDLHPFLQRPGQPDMSMSAIQIENIRDHALQRMWRISTANALQRRGTRTEKGDRGMNPRCLPCTASVDCIWKILGNCVLLAIWVCRWKVCRKTGTRSSRWSSWQRCSRVAKIQPWLSIFNGCLGIPEKEGRNRIGKIQNYPGPRQLFCPSWLGWFFQR